MISIQDILGFWIPRRGFRIPDSRYKITDLFQWNLDSRLHIKNFPDSGILILLHEAKFPLYSHPKTCKIYEKTKKS